MATPAAAATRSRAASGGGARRRRGAGRRHAAGLALAALGLVLAAARGAAAPGPARGPSQAAPAPLPAPSPRPFIPTKPLGGPLAILDLCEALRADDAPAAGAGNEVARARARDDRQRRRSAAMTANYAVDVPAAGFAFREYDLDGRRLIVDADRGFAVAEGVELLGADRETVLDFELPAEAADAVEKAKTAGQLHLRLVFRPARSEMTGGACVRQGGGRLAKLRVDVLAYDLLRPDGSVIARGETADFQEAASSARPVSDPTVIVRRPTTDGVDPPDSVAGAVQALAGPLLPCYQKALAAKPGLRGTLVVELRIGGDGTVEAPRMQVSSLGDEGLVSCAVARIGKLKLAKPPAPLRVSLPIVFGSRGEPATL